jgi:hypothetical protein
VFGALALVPGQWERLAVMFGWGVVTATLLAFWQGSTASQPGGPSIAQAAANPYNPETFSTTTTKKAA